MLPHRHSAISAGFVACLLVSLTGCANGSMSKALQDSFAADPRLEKDPVTFGSANNSSTGQNGLQAQLPEDFPAQIPLYPNAELQAIAPLSPSNSPTASAVTPEVTSTTGAITRWSTPDSIEAVQRFYQEAFQSNQWQLISRPTGELVARQQDLEVTVMAQPGTAAEQALAEGDRLFAAAPAPTPTPASLSRTELLIRYTRNASNMARANTESAVSQPGDPNFVGPVLPPNLATQPQTAGTGLATGSQRFTDLNQAPQTLRQYVADLAELGALPLRLSSTQANQSDTSNQFKPNETITRRDYARWLVAANNHMHRNRPAYQIRPGVETSQPAFQDVPTSDPDFPVIQGLAEAGIIPSSLSGDSTAVTFRPDAPLNRESLVLWKVPLDTRQALPNATIDAVKDVWGFQDASRIDPKALRAVLADHQNGDLANIRRAFAYTTLFQPKKPVTRAEAAAAIWYLGTQGEGQSAQDVLQAERQANKANPQSPQLQPVVPARPVGP